MVINKKYRRELYLLLASIMVTILLSLFYQISSHKSIHLKEFQKTIIAKQRLADKKIKTIENVIIHSSADSLRHLHFADHDISYYVVNENDIKVFWTDNQIDIDSRESGRFPEWTFASLSNAYGLIKTYRIDNLEIISFINIKHNYPYENKSLDNSFTEDFKLHKLTELKYGNSKDKYAIHSYNGQYLFSLNQPDIPVYNKVWGATGFVLSVFCLLLFFRLYITSYKLWDSRLLTLKRFGIVTGSASVFILLSLYFSFPSLLYWNELFSSAEYSSGPLLASIGHLTVLSLFIASAVYVFYFHVDISRSHKWIKIPLMVGVFGLYYILMHYILSSLIFHSSVQLITLKFNEITFWSIWFHFIIFVWGVGFALLFYKMHNWFNSIRALKKAILYDSALVVLYLLVFPFLLSSPIVALPIISFVFLVVLFYIPYFTKKRINIYTLSILLSVGFTLFFIINAQSILSKKTEEKYRVLAENINMNGSSENDRMAEVLLEDLDNQIINDKKLNQLSTYSDSIEMVNQYLNENYLRGFWNKYDMRLNVTMIGSGVHLQYDDFVIKNGKQLRNSHFYSIPASYNSMTYLGIFRKKSVEGDSLCLFMEFYPRKNFKSYSFPDLLINTAPDIQKQLKIAIAKYENNNLVYSSEKFEFPKNRNWIPNRKNDFFSFNFQNKQYYIYSPTNNTQIVITGAESHGFRVYLLYTAYILVIFIALGLLTVWMGAKQKKSYFHIGFTSRFQYAFLILLILSFLGIFYVSVDFIRQKYEDEQIKNIETKKTYIQNALQEMYYWSQDLTSINQQRLNFDLQELSYRYQTDIHVYDNYGVLVGSSQPLIFNKNLISRQISPNPFFEEKSNIIQQESIGKLNYLTGYTDFLNGDYLQIGYIAVPQFLSEEEIRSEIESYLSVIIHIYLIIIILAVILSFFIGQQLSAPLKMVENKLRQMRFGHRNEKIDYHLHDEIGQLVAQYNRTVDELEKSARLLAQSERESAWKTMARQIAHEINNPLTPMKLTIQQLQRTKKMGDERFDEYFEKSTRTLTEQIDNLSRIAGTFSNFARMPEAKFSRVDIASRINSVVQLFANNNDETEIIFSGSVSDVFVYADPEQLTQVFNNLLKNAIQSIPADRHGLIKVDVSDTSSSVIINITDNGCGIADEVAEKLFTPNFTTKSTGMGLGLTISKNIIEIAGGEISFSTRINTGTTFTVSLPKES
ncbi:MAG: integral rane sensor signal transduction histidine kinase [Bacteroidetes bacterium]|nr:integral rane sensor signal transduction histidine kinase [Bacteroidota bacterium]